MQVPLRFGGRDAMKPHAQCAYPSDKDCSSIYGCDLNILGGSSYLRKPIGTGTWPSLLRCIQNAKKRSSRPPTQFRYKMSSRGQRAAGTDGTDFQHRQRIAAHYQESAQYKFILKWFFAPHILILIFMWAKVGSEVLRREFGWRSAFFERLDMPSAYPWEYVWCLSFIPIICAMLSFSKNRVKLINYHYYGHFVFGILPCMIGLGGQLPELFDYMSDQENSQTPTFKGVFPMVIIWYIFFAVALQIHGFAMYFSYHLAAAWTPVKRD